RRQCAARQRARLQFPGIVHLLHQARFNAFLGRQCKQLRAQNGWHKTRDRLPHQQWFFLPVAAHELRGGQATEQRKRLVNFHENRPALQRAVGQTATILLWKSQNNAWSHSPGPSKTPWATSWTCW